MRLYPAFRDVHLYAGLFVSPFLLVFALSVPLLVHGWSPAKPPAAEPRVVRGVPFPADLEQLKAREQVDALRPVLDRLGVAGEIGFVRYSPRERRLSLPVSVPGRETTVDLQLATGTAAIATRDTGLWDAMIYLHRMPGPHNVALRGNAPFMQAWRWLADASVYALLLVSVTGLYLWLVLRSERRAGLAFLAAGACTFGGLVLALA